MLIRKQRWKKKKKVTNNSEECICFWRRLKKRLYCRRTMTALITKIIRYGCVLTDESLYCFSLLFSLVFIFSYKTVKQIILLELFTVVVHRYHWIGQVRQLALNKDTCCSLQIELTPMFLWAVWLLSQKQNSATFSMAGFVICANSKSNGVFPYSNQFKKS